MVEWKENNNVLVGTQGEATKDRKSCSLFAELCDVQKAARRSTASASSSTRHLNSNSAA